eukprot:TRINITY_DN32106_c0_g1_i1.p1 TRINITY_DN32106_c0_g1~~TRINITY_DN32106_c0_g1_i1.p1  ORF type:complete len:500 (+),score=214.51 TRINITY_DN32106_c0_g1_i1:72-1571(+)
MSRGAQYAVQRGSPPQSPEVRAADSAAVAAMMRASPALRKLRDMKKQLEQELIDAEQERQEQEQGDREERVIPLSLEDEFKPRVRRGQKAAQSVEKSKQPAKRRDREADQWLEDQRAEISNLKLKGQRLRCIIDLRQQSSKRKEDRCDAEIAELKNRLDATMIASHEHRETMARLREHNTQIQSRVGQLQSTIETQAEVDKMNLVRQYRVRMHELKKELAEEKQANYTGAQEWIDKNEMLEAELRNACTTLELVEASNEKLACENKDLKVKFKQQESERQVLVKQITQVRKESKRLAEQVARLEEEAISLAQHVSSKGADVSAGAKQQQQANALPLPSAAADHEARYLELINRVKRQLERERRTLEQVRGGHIDLLQERTELEVFLRQCVDDVRKEIARNTVAGPGLHGLDADRRRDSGICDYTVADRKRHLDLLMSKERVLNLLYAKTFPFKMPKATLADELELELDAADGARIQSASAELDMDTLWAKWKAWTEQSL